MNPLVARQVHLNATTQDRWHVYADHRARVTKLLQPPAAGGRLCVLGAGNCNDLDLRSLWGPWREIHGVDLDGPSLRAGVARQGLAPNVTIQCHEGIDVTGMFERISAWTPSSLVEPQDIADCADLPTEIVSAKLPGPFDGVASVGLLSQLMDGIERTVKADHPRFVELIQAVRLGHVRLLADLLSPGGMGLLVTDVVSSDSFEDLRHLADPLLGTALVLQMQARNFFHGVNPFVLEQVLRSEPRFAHVESLYPWRWDLGPRIYAVCGFRVWKR